MGEVTGIRDQGTGIRLSARNRAVWVLGQLGDSRALAVLERYYTGGPCEHGRCLCQLEIRKAIDLPLPDVGLPWAKPRFERS